MEPSLAPDEEPRFLDGVFLWDERGYAFKQTSDLELLDRVGFGSGNDWVEIATTLAAAKIGNFDPVGSMHALVDRTNLGAVASAALTLIGDAGRKEAVQRLVPTMTGASDAYVRSKACWAALHAGYLWLARPMLQAWTSIHPRERGNISLALSWLLESDFEFIAASEDFENPSEYVAKVEERIAELAAEHGDQAVLFRGRPMDVIRIAEAMMDGLESGESSSSVGIDLVQLRHRFEAMTGKDCSKFYLRGMLQPKEVTAAVQGFLADPRATRPFEAGVRYFFGHQVPD